MGGGAVTGQARFFGAALVLVAVGLALRLWHVTVEPLWLDEAYSAYAAAHPFGFIWHVAPRYEAHPPFYYTLLKLWTLLAGDGLAALRALGLIAGAATLACVVAATGEVVRLLGRPATWRAPLALAALALACVSGALVEMARQVRPYPIMILVYAAATAVLVRLAARTREGRALGGRTYAAYLLLAAAMLWLHSLGPLFAGAMALALAAGTVRRTTTRSDWAWLVGGHLALLVVYLPALAMLRDQAPTWEHSTWLRFGWAVLPDKLAALYAAPDWPVAGGIVLAVLGAIALAPSADGRRLLAMLVALAVVPVAAAVALSAAVAPVFLPRVLTPVAVPALLLFAIGATAWADWRRWLGLGGLLVLAFNMAAIDLQARAAGPMQDWYGAVGWLRARFRPGDVVLAYPNEGALPLERALRDEGLAYPVRPIPTAVPSFDPTGWHPTGYRAVVSLPRWRLRQIATAPETEAIPTIWLLRLGANAYDVGDVFLDELHRGRRIVRRWQHGPIDIIGLERPDPPLPGKGRGPAAGR